MSEVAKEFEAIKTVHDALEPLAEEARTRVLSYIASLMGIEGTNFVGSEAVAENGSDEEGVGAGTDTTLEGAPSFSTFAELYAATNPQSNGEKALIAGYWLQVCQAADNFTAAAANKELTNLGHKVANITDAMDSMKKLRPMLILQLKKTGTSRQARKLYKVSLEGVKRVREMIRG